MRKLALAAGLLLIVWPRGETAAQQSGTTRLVLNVAPESRLDPQQVELQFRVSQDGGSDVTSASATITARVRNLPGQPIRVAAQVADLHGPAAPVPASALRWTGSAVSATGGARQATCSSGTFSAGGLQDLVSNWQNAGMLTCAVNFELADPRSLPAGLYSGVVKLALAAQ